MGKLPMISFKAQSVKDVTKSPIHHIRGTVFSNTIINSGKKSLVMVPVGTGCNTMQQLGESSIT